MNEKLHRLVVITVSVTAITELALSQLSIKIMRLSAAELTGISYFAFIIFGLVTLFAVSRMKESFFGRIFAIIISSVSSLAGFWCLRMLFSDEIFFRNLYFNFNRQTQVYEQLPVSGIISASVPLALIILGCVIYYLCALVILIFSFIRKK
jgi:hypothetical protein